MKNDTRSDHLLNLVVIVLLHNDRAWIQDPDEYDPWIQDPDEQRPCDFDENDNCSYDEAPYYNEPPCQGYTELPVRSLAPNGYRVNQTRCPITPADVNLSTEQKNRVIQLVQRNRNVFAFGMSELGQSKGPPVESIYSQVLNQLGAPVMIVKYNRWGFIGQYILLEYIKYTRGGTYSWGASYIDG